MFGSIDENENTSFPEGTAGSPCTVTPAPDIGSRASWAEAGIETTQVDRSPKHASHARTDEGRWFIRGMLLCQGIWPMPSTRLQWQEAIEGARYIY
jgi:hypothetical protein